ncbi:hypothetical protein TNCV_689191 [Trichonephila clavipes]|nr:hypothetical protein TNCV_689191 [Trichonephila clavipes]
MKSQMWFWCMEFDESRADERDEEPFQWDPPPYIPNLAPSDLYFFGPLKKNLGGQHFRSNAEVHQESKCLYLQALRIA